MSEDWKAARQKVEDLVEESKNMRTIWKNGRN